MNGRLVVVDQVNHQLTERHPVSVTSRFSRELSSDEQSYRRTVKISEEWQPLDMGWLKQGSMLVISNDEGKFTQLQPTTLQIQQAMAKVVQVGIESESADGCKAMHVFGQVNPKESMRWTPVNPDKIRLRCMSGTALCDLVLIPV